MNTESLMFALIRDVFSDRLDDFDGVEWEVLLPHLYELSKSHDMAHIVAEALDRRGKLEGETAARFQKQRMLAVFRHSQSGYELELLSKVLEQAQIAFLPLKGAILRDYYPESWMRTSCDIDVLVRESDLDAAMTALTEQADYRFEERCAHDVAFLSPRGVRVELHFDLVGENRAKDASHLLRTVWDDASLEPGYCYRYRMSDAMFYLYHVAHMAKHFEIGGCGVRPFLDLWLMDRTIDRDRIDQRDALLRRARLEKFAEAARKLSLVWFSGAAYDDLLKEMSRYILRAGGYGCTSNRVAAGKAQKGGGFAYLWSRLFLSYGQMQQQYPTLKKHKWLLPFYQVRRWFSRLFGGRAGYSIRELKRTMTMSDAHADRTAEMLRQLELL